MLDPDRPWSTRDTPTDEPVLVGLERARLEAVQDGATTLRILTAYQQVLERNTALLGDPGGPGGPIDIVTTESQSLVAGDTRPYSPTRVFVRGQIDTLTSQVPRVLAWLGGFSTDAQVIDTDDRLGVSLIEVSGVVADRLLAEIRALSSTAQTPPTTAPGGAGGPLWVGVNDVTMQAGPVKRSAPGAGPQPTGIGLGSRPDNTRSGAGISVAVIDGGFEQPQNRRTDGWDANVRPPRDVQPFEIDPGVDVDHDGLLDLGAGHGTFVSGLVAQVAPAAVIRQYRALDSFGFGNVWRLKNRILQAVEDGCQVINLSLGFDDAGLIGSPTLSACLHAVPSQVMVVAAAGNAGSTVPSLPAAHKATIGVGALNTALEPCAWSNAGPWVDVSCVGLGVVSTFVVGQTSDDPAPDPGPNPVRAWAGTSFSAPQVSGLLARLLSSGLTPAQAWDEVRRSAVAQTGPAHPALGLRLRIL